MVKSCFRADFRLVRKSLERCSELATRLNLMTKLEEEEKAPVKVEKRDVIVQKVRFCEETNCQSQDVFYSK